MTIDKIKVGGIYRVINWISCNVKDKGSTFIRVTSKIDTDGYFKYEGLNADKIPNGSTCTPRGCIDNTKLDGIVDWAIEEVFDQDVVKFKVGDKVKVKDTPNTRVFGKGSSVGYIGYLTAEDCYELNRPQSSYILFENKFSTNFKYDDIELVPESNQINEVKPQKNNIFMNVVSFVKKQALKVGNPNEFELREAGIHNDCGELTSEGVALRDSFLEALVADKILEVAKAINAERATEKE